MWSSGLSYLLTPFFIIEYGLSTFCTYASTSCSIDSDMQLDPGHNRRPFYAAESTCTLYQQKTSWHIHPLPHLQLWFPLPQYPSSTSHSSAQEAATTFSKSHQTGGSGAHAFLRQALGTHFHICLSRVLTWDGSHSVVHYLFHHARERQTILPQMDGHLLHNSMRQPPCSWVLLMVPRFSCIVQRKLLPLEGFRLPATQ